MLRFLAFCDIHGNVDSVKNLIRKVKNEQFDAVIFAGDFTNAFLDRDLVNANKKYQTIMKLLQSLDIPIYYVLGNRDYAPTGIKKNVLDGKFFPKIWRAYHQNHQDLMIFSETP